MLRILVQSLKIAVIGVAALLVLVGGRAFLTYVLDRETVADTGKPVVVKIGKDDTSGSVAKRLSHDGLIRSQLYFKLRLRLANRELKEGTYTLRKGMSVPEIVDALSGGPGSDEAANPELQARAGEGWRTEEIAAAFEKAGLKAGAKGFIDATKTVDPSQYDFLKDRPKGATLEGYLFPDTYNFRADTPPADLVDLMLKNFDAKFTPPMRQRASEMHLTIYQVLTIASIVERETADPKERATVASVYYNRLEQGMTLDADPTVQYALGKPGAWWPQLQPGQPQQVNSPYNTYKNPGFPKAPICNPSLASIQAALNPADTKFLYFVAKNDGSGTHAFAETLDEQQANIDQYLNGHGTGAGTAGGGATAASGAGATAAAPTAPPEPSAPAADTPPTAEATEPPIQQAGQ